MVVRDQDLDEQEWRAGKQGQRWWGRVMGARVVGLKFWNCAEVRAGTRDLRSVWRSEFNPKTSFSLTAFILFFIFC